MATEWDNETPHSTTWENEEFSNPPAKFGMAKFGKSRFGKIKAGEGTDWDNETKH